MTVMPKTCTAARDHGCVMVRLVSPSITKKRVVEVATGSTLLSLTSPREQIAADRGIIEYLSQSTCYSGCSHAYTMSSGLVKTVAGEVYAFPFLHACECFQGPGLGSWFTLHDAEKDRRNTTVTEGTWGVT